MVHLINGCVIYFNLLCHGASHVYCKQNMGSNPCIKHDEKIIHISRDWLCFWIIKISLCGKVRKILRKTNWMHDDYNADDGDVIQKWMQMIWLCARKSHDNWLPLEWTHSSNVSLRTHLPKYVRMPCITSHRRAGVVIITTTLINYTIPCWIRFVSVLSNIAS